MFSGAFSPVLSQACESNSYREFLPSQSIASMVSMLVFAGCGSKEEAKETSTTVEEESETTTEAEPEEDKDESKEESIFVEEDTVVGSSVDLVADEDTSKYTSDTSDKNETC